MNPITGIDALFNPASVAVIGASRTPGKVGHDIFHSILAGDYEGTLYPVNPKAKAVCCVRSYPSIIDIPDSVDLAIVILPPVHAESAIREAISKGVRAIVICSAGFKEVGGEGAEIELRIAAACREAGVRLVGPNCLGVINPLGKLNASFSARMPKAGNISFISQSGALCAAVLDFAADRDFGFSKFISIGNKADVDELHLLQYLHADPDTEVIMLYLEELHRGPEFIHIVKEITGGERPTPILAIKSGRTSDGAMAAVSHTGSLAGSEAVYDAVFTQSGIIRVDSINELFDFGVAFACHRGKLPVSNRVAIISNAGGPGIIATDMTVSSNARLAKFDDDTISALKSHLPPTANVNNPVDVIGDAASSRYEDAMECVIKCETVDGVLVILTPQSMTDVIGTAEVIVKIARNSQKPIFAVFMGIIDVSKGVKYLQENHIPVYRFPESAAKAFGALYRYSHFVNRPHLAQFTFKHDRAGAREIVQEAIENGETYIGEIRGTKILSCYGFSVNPTKLTTTAEEAADFAEHIDYPVVMKIVSPQIIHKSDGGGVIVGLVSRDQVIEAYDKIIKNAQAFKPDVDIKGVLVQKLAPKGNEVILGMTRYPIFGPLLMFGTGGVFVEVFKDVSFRLAPVTRNGAHKMVNSVKGYRLLNGYRGSSKADLLAIERMLVALSDLAMDIPEIKELDINPLFVHPKGKGATVADCRFILDGHTAGSVDMRKAPSQSSLNSW
eukprot:CAMPEP_0119015334 /NCGR_PEP_ID=MMETSP1176-20130426/10834_1 /TAXON_ID=265551 /ORGANISM="Synedropsis recta cf, Strain CCMP1620" /LENGTH=727 /DNA_ID=CAMNT_0006968621 /DNA_START=157 /DNA_END=2337 /DNA_ORIENTATION=-